MFIYSNDLEYKSDTSKKKPHIRKRRSVGKTSSSSSMQLTLTPENKRFLINCGYNLKQTHKQNKKKEKQHVEY